MSTLAIDLSDLVRLDDMLKTAPEIVDQELLAFTQAMTSHLEAEVVDRTPTGVNQMLRRTIAGTVSATPSGMLGVVATNSPYGPAVEHGTKPHWAPLEPLVDWVKGKINAADPEAVARRIRFKIAHHGTKGAGMFQKTFDANQALVRAEFRKTIERIKGRMEGRL